MEKYLQFTEQAKRINEQYGLTRHEIALLDLSAIRQFSNAPITTGELLRQVELASQPTLRAAFKTLVEKNLLTTLPSAADGRIKQVAITSTAWARIKNLDHAMRKCSRSE